MTFPAVLFLSAFSGYFSLSQEILWVHALGYATGGDPQLFAHVLGAFLLGIAGGSLFVERRTQREGFTGAVMLPALLLGAAALAYLVLPGLARLFVVAGREAIVAAYAAVALLAFTGGCTFPLLCHVGIRGDRVGSSLSWVYAANIAGSVCGPLLTTFVLMDRLSLAGLLRVVAIGTVGCAVAALYAAPPGRKARAIMLGVGAALVALTLTAHGPLYAGILERLQFKETFTGEAPFRHVVETRSGIVTVGGDKDHTVYGGGMYDGRFNVDPAADTNRIKRGYLLPALHRSPAEVLEIGLATGSWSRVLVAHPAVKTLDVIEINPGYLEIIRRYPDQAEILSDPKVTIHIDDGRRWLNRNPDRTFDFILMNTTWHWRSQVTNLVSREFLALCRRHLKPGGVLYYNTTDSNDVAYTGARAFTHLVRFENFVAVSDAPFDMTPQERREGLMKFAMHGRPVFDPKDPKRTATLAKLAAEPLADKGPALRAREDLWLVTDDNMATEFRRAERPIARRDTASRIWKRLRE